MMSDSYKNTLSLSISLKRLAIIFFDLSVYFKTSEFVCWRTVYTVYISQKNHDLDNYVHQYVLTSYIQNASSYLSFCLHAFRVSRKHDHHLYDPSCIKLAQTCIFRSRLEPIRGNTNVVTEESFTRTDGYIRFCRYYTFVDD